ncbi:MAG TPA: hypothetical protein VLE22_22350 [Bryobacteraceae bacterium]|nr:hypothetical protein [Bryobacteraceae bacterium]
MGTPAPEQLGAELREVARRRLERRPFQGSAIDYGWLAATFRSEPGMDPYGFGQLVAEIEQTGGVYPPEPPTLRGRLGRFLIDLEYRVLWWLVRAISRRDQAWRAAYHMMLALHEKQVELRLEALGRISEIEARISLLEERLSRTKPEDRGA